MKTLLPEQNDIIGGCCSTFGAEGFYFDTGASIVEMPQGIDLIFERLGRKREDYIDFRKCEPMYSFRVHADDLPHLQLYLVKTAKQVKNMCYRYHV